MYEEFRLKVRQILSENQELVDRILDKITASGMDSLTDTEKTYLHHKSENKKISSGFVYESDNPKFEQYNMSFEYRKAEKVVDDIAYAGYLRVRDEKYKGTIIYSPAEDKIYLDFVNVVDYRTNIYKEQGEIEQILEEFCMETVGFLSQTVSKEDAVK